MKRIHFVGIKGVGMSALAIVAQGMGYIVTGSDVAEEFITDSALKQAGIEPFIGFASDHITTSIQTVVVGTAFGSDNPEVQSAKALSVPMVTYSEFLGRLTQEKKTIAVAGTHGKTTTTSLVAYIMHKSGLSPSWVIGTGHIIGLPSHGYAGQGHYFVTEADDYKRAQNDPTPKFLDLKPWIAIVTSIEHDHPDIYPTLNDCVNAFRQFLLRVAPSGFAIVNGDDPNIKKLRGELTSVRFLTYGFNQGNDYRILPLERKDNTNTWFKLIGQEGELGPFIVPLPGWHNLMNAAAAILACLKSAVTTDAIQEILPSFESVERRFQIIGTAGERIIVDDYAHHPTAVRVTLETAKEIYPDKPIWCLFQSHTFSRTKTLLAEFGRAFGAADNVIVTDIFGSARESDITITAEDLAAEIAKHQPHVAYEPRQNLVTYLKAHLPANSVLITMGAGDIYKVGHEYLSYITAHR
jgi:UDP-N-acetylmuramate--alanine ligase